MNGIQTKNVIHDVVNHRFMLNIDDEVVQTKYRMIDDKTIEFYSTHTPNELRGQGLAVKVVTEALDYAAQQGLEVIPTCWYVAKIMDRRKNVN